MSDKLEDLQKALDKFRDALLDNDACDHILAEYDGLYSLFSVFQKDYDKQAHVDHKELSELIAHSTYARNCVQDLKVIYLANLLKVCEVST